MAYFLRLIVGVIFFISVESNALQPGYKFVGEKVTASDGQPGNLFGSSVSISGNTALVGAPGRDDGANWAIPGAIYFFEQSDNGWIEHQKFDGETGFGLDVSIFGDNAAVLSYQSIYFYRRQSDQWQFIKKMPVSNTVCSISMSDKFLAVLGTPPSPVKSFEYINEDWVYQQTLSIEVEDETASFPIFCNNISLSGETLVIGLDRGTHIFNQINGVWTKSQEITDFGGAVSISGNSLIAPRNDLQTIGVYEASSVSAPSQTPLWELQQEVIDPDTLAGEQFMAFGLGLTDTSLSGDLAVVSRWDSRYGASSALVYTRAGGVWTQRQNLSAGVYADRSYFGQSISATENTILVGAHKNGSTQNIWTESLSGGAVYFFSPQPDIDTPAEIKVDISSVINPLIHGKITAIDMDGLSNPNYLSISMPTCFSGSSQVDESGDFLIFSLVGCHPDIFTVTVTDDLGGTTEKIISLEDSDNDGEYNYSDNCLSVFNPSQDDFDNDGVGDACDTENVPAMGGIGLLALGLSMLGLGAVRLRKK